MIVDRALAFRDDRHLDAKNLAARHDDEPDRLAVDYGVEFANMDIPAANRFRLFKLHGSFNWSSSGVTGDLYFGGLTKAIGYLYNDAESVLVPDLPRDRELRGNYPARI